MIIYLFLTFLVVQGYSATPKHVNVSDPLVREFLQDFPVVSFTAIAKKHLEHDPEFQSAVVYLQGDEFQTILKNIREYPDWVAFKIHVKNIGIDVEPMIHCSTRAIKTVQINQKNVNGINPNLTNFLLHVKSELGMHIIKATLKTGAKVRTDKNLNEMFEKLRAEDTKQMVFKLVASNQFQKLFDSLKMLGIHVDEDLKFVYTLFQWNE